MTINCRTSKFISELDNVYGEIYARGDIEFSCQAVISRSLNFTKLVAPLALTVIDVRVNARDSQVLPEELDLLVIFPGTHLPSLN